MSLVVGDSNDLDDIGLKYDWFDLHIDSFRVPEGENPPDSGEDEKNLNYSLSAKRARVSYESTAIMRDAFAQDDLNATLYDVTVQMMSGLPFSCTTKLEAPRLIVDVAIERLTSIEDDVVTFRSRNINGSGVGFDVRMQDGFIGFERGSDVEVDLGGCLLYTSPSPRDRQKSRMPSSA